MSSNTVQYSCFFSFDLLRFIFQYCLCDPQLKFFENSYCHSRSGCICIFFFFTQNSYIYIVHAYFLHLVSFFTFLTSFRNIFFSKNSSQLYPHLSYISFFATRTIHLLLHSFTFYRLTFISSLLTTGIYFFSFLVNTLSSSLHKSISPLQYTPLI